VLLTVLDLITLFVDPSLVAVGFGLSEQRLCRYSSTHGEQKTSRRREGAVHEEISGWLPEARSRDTVSRLEGRRGRIVREGDGQNSEGKKKLAQGRT
jgi:hypothetical protein